MQGASPRCIPMIKGRCLKAVGIPFMSFFAFPNVGEELQNTRHGGWTWSVEQWTHNASKHASRRRMDIPSVFPPHRSKRGCTVTLSTQFDACTLASHPSKAKASPTLLITTWSTTMHRQQTPRPPPTPQRVSSPIREETLSCASGRVFRGFACRARRVFASARFHTSPCTFVRRLRFGSAATRVDRTRLVAIRAARFGASNIQRDDVDTQPRSTDVGETCSDGWPRRRRHARAMERLLARRVELRMHVGKRGVPLGGAAKAGDAKVGEAAGKTCSWAGKGWERIGIDQRRAGRQIDPGMAPEACELQKRLPSLRSKRNSARRWRTIATRGRGSLHAGLGHSPRRHRVIPRKST